MHISQHPFIDTFYQHILSTYLINTSYPCTKLFTHFLSTHMTMKEKKKTTQKVNERMTHCSHIPQ